MSCFNEQEYIHAGEGAAWEIVAEMAIPPSYEVFRYGLQNNREHDLQLKATDYAKALIHGYKS